MVAALWTGAFPLLIAAPPRLVPVGRSVPFKGRMIELTPDWTLTIGPRSAARTFSHRQWLRWGAMIENRFEPYVVLSDGSSLSGQLVAVSRSHVVVDHPILDLVTLPREVVSGAVLRPPLAPASRDRLHDWITQKGPQRHAALRLIDGDELEGDQVPPAELPRPLPLELASLSWRIPGTPEPVDVRLANVQAIRWQPGVNPPAPQDAGIVSLDDGSRLAVSRATIGNSTFECRLICGVTLQAKTSERLPHVVYLRPPARSFRFLSASRPSDHRHLPLLRQTVPYRLDRAARGTRLRAGARLYEFGIGTFGRNRLVYDVPPDARALSVEVAVDAAGDTYSSVRFRIYVVGEDGTPRLATESDVMRVGSAPRHLWIDVTRSRQVVLIVDTADWLDRRDAADWLEACWILRE